MTTSPSTTTLSTPPAPALPLHRRAARSLLESSWPLLKAGLFMLDAETAHHLTLRGLGTASRLGALKLLPEVAEAAPVTVAGLRFSNRVGLAAGLDKAGTCVDGFGAMGFGFVEIGTLTPRPQPGNPQPRLFRIVEREAIVNRMGFNNPGIAQGRTNAEASGRRQWKGVLGVNIGKNFDTSNTSAADDYVLGLHGAWEWADYVTVNLSSPNTKGLRDLQQDDSCRALLRILQGEQKALAQRHGRHVPVFIKISPDLEPAHLRSLARIFVEEKLEGVIATNTTLSRTHTEGLRHSGEGGGLSGAPLTERATALISDLARELDGALPIIGAGGIMDGHDAVEKLRAGAVLVQLYSGLIYRGPALVRECVEACAAAVREEKL
ncbi:MAG: dihydroorotate dehydrogenase, subfamily 2 [Verrucomicrobiales bacterium]|nr:dihydroorotate dehydrogenase, subfamily 2 [Verrucomicrobiales bacterium]